MRITSDEETFWASVDYVHEMIQSVRPRAKTDNLASLLPSSQARPQKTANNGCDLRLMERWVTFRHHWESKEELLRAGPSKSEYLFLVLIYPYLYLLSGVIHELGHVIGALIAGDPIVMISFTPTVFSVTVQGIGRSLTLARSMGGLFQGMFLSVFAQRYRFLWSVTASCFAYAIAEATGVLWLMSVCSFFSEIVGTLIIIYLAC